MIVFRRRLFFWLVKAYIKKWGKQILLFIAIGIILSYLLFTKLYGFFTHIAQHKRETIGIVGTYTLNSLPKSVISDISKGLTTVSDKDVITPALAKSWKIQDSGKTYIFTLDNQVRFTDGHKFTSSDVNYKFSDAQIIRPNDQIIIFKLKDSYSPFLVTVSKPIFRNGTVGTGPYKVTDIKINGSFVQSITLTLASDPYRSKKYIFYPTQEALKIAFLIGEVGQAFNLSSVKTQKGVSLVSKNTHVSKNIDYTHLVTLFYNFNDPVLSDKKLRLALSYAIPDTFEEGARTYVPYPPFLFTYTDQFNKTQDIDHAKLLMEESSAGSTSAHLSLSIKYFPRYKEIAQIIAKNWKQIGITVSMDEVESIPAQFQIFLGDFLVPLDPDQYMLWHSDQANNITNYKNLRIDKLLEDGRKTFAQTQSELENERQKIYYDFQKYLLDDEPASFLYFPYQYTIERR